MITRSTTCLIIVIFLLAGVLQATSLTFQEGVSPSGAYVADSTTIRSDFATTPQDDDPQFENIVGRVGGSFMRNLYEFDLTAITNEANGRPVIVNSVDLHLTTRGANQGTSLTVDLHQYNFDFVESAATWNDPDGDGAAGTGDTTAGGSLGTLLATETFASAASSDGTLLTIDDTAAFQTAVLDALASSDNTLRLLLKRNVESGSGNEFIRFYDEVFATASQRPELAVDFQIIPEPASIALWSLLGLACIGYSWRRYRRA